MYIPRMTKMSKKIIIFSGAGLDAPSGVQTFRGANGLWGEHKISEVCTENTWKDNFELVHKFYNERRKELKEVDSNKAHKWIKEITDKYGKENVFNITMNVSDLQEREGVECLHLHGKLREMKCEGCGKIWDIGYKEWDIEKDACPGCGEAKEIKPNIVFFGDAAPMYTYLYRALEYLNNPNSVIIVIGTQSNVVDIDSLIYRLPCYKIVCNMESNEKIDEKQYDEVFIESIEDATDKITECLNRRGL